MDEDTLSRLVDADTLDGVPCTVINLLSFHILNTGVVVATIDEPTWVTSSLDTLH